MVYPYVHTVPVIRTYTACRTGGTEQTYRAVKKDETAVIHGQKRGVNHKVI